MKKKLTVILLAAVLAIGNLSACGSSKEAADTTAAASSVKSEAAASAEKSEAAASAEKSEAAAPAEKDESAASAEKTEAAAPAEKSEAAAPSAEGDAAEESAQETPTPEAQVPAGESAEAEDTVKEEPAAEPDITVTSEPEKEPEAASAESSETGEKAKEGEEPAIVPVGEEQSITGSFLSGGFLVGGLKPVEDTPEPEALSEEEQAAMDRSMRAYKASGSSLLKNNAKKFYYYAKMNEDEKSLYDAMMMVCEDPVNPDNVTKAVISVDPYSYDFSDLFYVAYYGMLYDHAELFWLYNFTECDMQIYVPYESSVPEGQYEVYFALDKPYENYETEMKKFNKAVKKFLEDIDTSKSAPEIVKAIHNKLVNKVTYNNAVAADNSYWGYCNFAHTAYGALVEDSDGVKNSAVCDGYAQAFVYLLQQCGITAAVIVGEAGEDEYSAGGHAWSVVKLDKDWYEIDSTWDDPGSLEEAIESIRDLDSFSYTYFREAFDDKTYNNKCRYYLYNLTTDAISSFVPDEYYYYYSKDGNYVYSLLGNSVHIRASYDTWGFEDYAPLMALAPTAKGTAYAMR